MRLRAVPGSKPHTAAFVEAALSGLERADDLHLVICRRDSGEFLGICGLHGNGQPAEPEVGIWIKKAAHGNGYGLEAIAALKEWAEANIEFDRLIYPVDRYNTPSRKIPEALGGKIIAERKEMSMAGTELDEVIYGIESEASRDS